MLFVKTMVFPKIFLKAVSCDHVGIPSCPQKCRGNRITIFFLVEFQINIKVSEILMVSKLLIQELTLLKMLL